ncbi:hypothetical protein DPMN_181252 [Dreissena polymorpha]|uniref:Uncharacterized protein n=1 Tax=Dreissena polymorpha TaxID=45954 RepID=A0A9D4DE36_DREPO|nr:hypothetical protein DPMN_181252 [Dreissena polymorpha]
MNPQPPEWLLKWGIKLTTSRVSNGRPELSNGPVSNPKTVEPELYQAQNGLCPEEDCDTRAVSSPEEVFCQTPGRQCPEVERIRDVSRDRPYTGANGVVGTVNEYDVLTSTSSGALWALQCGVWSFIRRSFKNKNENKIVWGGGYNRDERGDDVKKNGGEVGGGGICGGEGGGYNVGWGNLLDDVLKKNWGVGW